MLKNVLKTFAFKKSQQNQDNEFNEQQNVPLITTVTNEMNSELKFESQMREFYKVNLIFIKSITHLNFVY